MAPVLLSRTRSEDFLDVGRQSFQARVLEGVLSWAGPAMIKLIV